MKDFDSLASLGPDELWNADVAGRYDTPGSGSFAPEVLGPMVDRLARLAGAGPVLEFAVGTGRVAIPLVERGVSVTGLEYAQPMIDRLRENAWTLAHQRRGGGRSGHRTGRRRRDRA